MATMNSSISIGTQINNIDSIQYSTWVLVGWLFTSSVMGIIVFTAELGLGDFEKVGKLKRFSKVL